MLILNPLVAEIEALEAFEDRLVVLDVRRVSTGGRALGLGGSNGGASVST